MTNTAIETITTTTSGPAIDRDALFEISKDIATHPNILDLLITQLNGLGFVGEERATRLIYLALTSRVLKDPVSIVVKGPSSAGKSHTTQQVLRFFPSEAYYALTAMSEKALVYSKEPLKHRFLVIYEAEGMKGETASYFIRTLLSEGCIKHKTLTQSGGEWTPKELCVEGPTGLLTTTTLPLLHAENETRLLSVPVNDTAEQTQRIMLAMASEIDGVEIDYAPWLAFQQWLSSGPTVVTIPFGPDLAKLAFAGSVRIRRDFRKLLTLIRTHALIHQVNRQKTAAGAIEATFQDYSAVRSLVLDLMGEAAESTVSATVRETVNAVAKLLGEGRQQVSVTQLAAELSLDKSTASRRVAEAIGNGFLSNFETRQGMPSKLTLGDPLPEDIVVLPEVEVLAS